MDIGFYSLVLIIDILIIITDNLLIIIDINSIKIIVNINLDTIKYLGINE